MTDVSIRKFGHRHVQKENDVKTQGMTDSHLQAKEGDQKQILPSWPSKETKPADTLTSNF